MKYGLLYFKDTSNLGDDIQTFAQEQFLPQIDYYIDREYISDFKSENGESVAMISNAWWMWKKWNFFPSKNIVPLLISMHITDWGPTNWGSSITNEIFTGLGKEYLNTYGPIGCRDYSTQCILKENGINNYFSGCLTLTLPNMERIDNKNPYICLVDVDETVLQYIKENIKENVEIKVFTHDLPKTNRELTWNERRKNVIERLTIYQNSICVITSRLHASLPCLALNTPVCLVRDDIDVNRFDSYLPYVNNCSINQFTNGFYDFNNPPNNSSDYLKLKKNLIKTCNNFIRQTKAKSNLLNLNKFNYTQEEIDKWRFDVMKSGLEKWFNMSRDMLREYNKTIDYLRKIEKENQNFKNSTSWKFTKPLRILKVFLKRIIGK